MGPWLNFSSEVIHLRNTESGSELVLLVISIHKYAHHSLWVLMYTSMYKELPSTKD